MKLKDTFQEVRYEEKFSIHRGSSLDHGLYERISGMDAIRAQEEKAFEQSPIFHNFDEYCFSEPERAIVDSKATYIRHIEGRGLHLINQYDIIWRDGEWRIIRQVIEALPTVD